MWIIYALTISYNKQFLVICETFWLLLYAELTENSKHETYTLHMESQF